MKRNIKLAALFVLFALVFTSCGEKKNEWTNYYGYTNEDIIGEYSYSNDYDSFYGVLESDYSHICTDAEITIKRLSDNYVSFHVNCPEAGYDRTFEGSPTKNRNDFKISMSSGFINGTLKSYNVLAYVSKNDQNQIRLHGFASYDSFKVVATYPIPNGPAVYDTVCDLAYNYYFDMIKD